jgi:hypothetical protein
MARKKQIKSTNVVRTKDREIDPQFAVRKGRVDAKQAERSRYDEEEDDIDVINAEDVDIEDFPGGYNDPTELLAPEGMTIISQTARLYAEGRIVVDVVVDLGPAGGATGYNIRMGTNDNNIGTNL